MAWPWPNSRPRYFGYACLDRTLVAQVARIADLPEKEVQGYDEKGQGTIADLFSRLFVGTSERYPVYAYSGGYPEVMIAPGAMHEGSERAPDRRDLVSITEQVVRAATERGKVVIVGRGGQAILSSWPDVLHVRLIAPLVFRCRRIAEREGINPEAARSLIQRTDRDRARYIRQHYNVDWEDRNLYHLTVNTERTGVERAARLIAGAAERSCETKLSSPQQESP